MVTFSEFIKICPKIKDDLIISVRFVGEEIEPKYKEWNINYKSFTWKEFSEKFDFKKLQIINYDHRYIGYENGEYYHYLTLRKL